MRRLCDFWYNLDTTLGAGVSSMMLAAKRIQLDHNDNRKLRGIISLRSFLLSMKILLCKHLSPDSQKYPSLMKLSSLWLAGSGEHYVSNVSTEHWTWFIVFEALCYLCFINNIFWSSSVLTSFLVKAQSLLFYVLPYVIVSMNLLYFVCSWQRCYALRS